MFLPVPSSRLLVVVLSVCITNIVNPAKSKGSLGRAKAEKVAG